MVKAKGSPLNFEVRESFGFANRRLGMVHDASDFDHFELSSGVFLQKAASADCIELKAGTGKDGGVGAICEPKESVAPFPRVDSFLDGVPQQLVILLRG